jgi:orotate phosphoribosyltransferase
VGIAVLVDRSGGAVDFGAPLHALTRLEIETWDPGACPLCAEGLPLIKPGSTAPTGQ